MLVASYAILLVATAADDNSVIRMVRTRLQPPLVVHAVSNSNLPSEHIEGVVFGSIKENQISYHWMPVGFILLHINFDT